MLYDKIYNTYIALCIFPNTDVMVGASPTSARSKMRLGLEHCLPPKKVVGPVLHQRPLQRIQGVDQITYIADIIIKWTLSGLIKLLFSC